LIEDTASPSAEAGSSPWRPRSLGPGEILARERIASRVPALGAALPLWGLAEAARAGSASMRITGISPAAREPSRAALPIALESDVGGGTSRLVAEISSAGIRGLVDRLLGRSEDGDPSAPLTSGEEGALLFALDRIGGDWLAARGDRFTVRGVLSDVAQVAEYLGREPAWEVSGAIHLDDLVCEAHLLVPETPARSSARRRATPVSGSAAGWPVRVRLLAGGSSLGRLEVAGLERGDLVILDWGGHPLLGPGGPARLVSGVFEIGARWLDTGRLGLLSEEEWRSSMSALEGTGEIAARLEPGATADASGMEVEVRVEVGRLVIGVGDALGLVPGRVVRLDREASAGVDLLAGDKLVARGELVEYEGRMAVEITEVLS